MAKTDKSEEKTTTAGEPAVVPPPSESDELLAHLADVEKRIEAACETLTNLQSKVIEGVERVHQLEAKASHLEERISALESHVLEPVRTERAAEATGRRAPVSSSAVDPKHLHTLRSLVSQASSGSPIAAACNKLLDDSDLTREDLLALNDHRFSPPRKGLGDEAVHAALDAFFNKVD